MLTLISSLGEKLTWDFWRVRGGLLYFPVLKSWGKAMFFLHEDTQWQNKSKQGQASSGPDLEWREGEKKSSLEQLTIGTNYQKTVETSFLAGSTPDLALWALLYLLYCPAFNRRLYPGISKDLDFSISPQILCVISLLSHVISRPLTIPLCGRDIQRAIQY